MPPKSADRCATQAGLIWLLAVAAQRPRDPGEIVAQVLAGIGWMLASGRMLSAADADRAAMDTRKWAAAARRRDRRPSSLRGGNAERGRRGLRPRRRKCLA
jgi:hypothetical protein